MTHLTTETRPMYSPALSGVLGAEDELVSPLRLLNALLAHWRLIAVLPIVLSIIVGGLTLARPRTFTARGSFVPQSGENAASRLSSIAAQFGIDAGGGPSNVAQSPAFYRTLLLSDEILSGLSAASYSVKERGSSGAQSLPKLLEIDEPTPGLTEKATIDHLKEMIAVSVDRETGLVEISARTEWPSLSVQLIDKSMSLVEEFNKRKRQEQAGAERAFLQEQLDNARAQLRGAEDALQRFLQGNRMYQGDPQLVFAYDRLRRDVEMRQSVYSTLSQAYERTTLDALRDTPVITKVQRPVLPPLPDKRGLGLKLFVSLVFGAFFGGLLALAGEYVHYTRHRDPLEYERFQQLQREVTSSVRSLVRKG